MGGKSNSGRTLGLGQHPEKTKTLAEVWVDKELRLSFRRTFSPSIMQV
jgi:hypothetical protein